VPINQKLEPVIEETINGFRFQAQRKNITIELEGNIKAMALFDQNIIATVLRNLIANALKFSKVGGAITIKVAETRSEVYISVVDRGIGINPQLVQAITEGKGISSNMGTENEKGNGLGLSLCYDLIKMHGGKLDVYSLEGQGATFSFPLSKKIVDQDE